MKSWVQWSGQDALIVHTSVLSVVATLHLCKTQFFYLKNSRLAPPNPENAIICVNLLCRRQTSDHRKQSPPKFFRRLNIFLLLWKYAKVRRFGAADFILHGFCKLGRSQREAFSKEHNAWEFYKPEYCWWRSEKPIHQILTFWNKIYRVFSHFFAWVYREDLRQKKT